MASIGVVNADTPKTQDSMNTTNRPKKYYFGVFFDGTSNNMIQKEEAKKSKKNSFNSDDWEFELISTEDDTLINFTLTHSIEAYSSSVYILDM